MAERGQFRDIPSDIYIRYYGNLQRIAAETIKPIAMEREVYVYWGKTGTGKTRRAWDEATLEAYPKDPRTKFWDGYRNQEHVIIDEFRGGIDISHILRWLDIYPVIVEVKGTAIPLNVRKIWITSNLDPRDWYPTLDAVTKDALMRRFNVCIHFLDNALS